MRLILFVSVCFAIGLAEPAFAFRDDTIMPCNEIGIARSGFADLEEEISHAQAKIRDLDIKSCIIDSHSSVWFRKDGDIYKLKFLRFSGPMQF